jgi:CheY-like chemotaxis protein
MRLLLRAVLSGMGCRVSEASSGESAVEMVRTSYASADHHERIEMVFCDMRMPPGMNGFETARRIKMIGGTECLPIVGMTADDVSHVALQEARDVGMVSLVSKPLGRTHLACFLADHTHTVSVLNEAAPPEHKDDDNDDGEGCVFDEEIALGNCDNDAELLRNLLSDLAADLKTRRDDLARSVQRKDWARTAEVARDIKGMTAICGFKRLAKASSQLQEFASRGDHIPVRTQSQVVMEEISRCCRVAMTMVQA